MCDKSLDDKLGLLKQLILLANADGVINEAEYQLLLSLAQNIGISEEDFEMVFSPNISLSAPKDFGERILQFHRMILLINVDNHPSPLEIEVIRNLGIMLGLNPQATELIICEMKSHPNNLIPPDRMIQIFSKYLN
jgi:hypothetical protein